MPEIDPVILQLRADVAKYRADVDSVTRRVTDQLGSQEKSVIRLENQIKRSTANISTSFKAIATSLAAGFSAKEVADMADSYTRFTNQLKVTGLESGNLAKIQGRLFEVAQRNGVEIEAIGTLYSRAAQNQKELGASTEDLIDLTRSVAASLRISGESTNEASGALLQLGQALGSPRVQAEEFNSLLDTMQPLLRAASKYIDGTGGSISGLTRKIKDQQGPGVSNVELFRAITRAMADLEKTASGTTLTIGGAFTNLSNALTKYIGEADSANGATLAVTTALNALAENLDTVTEAIAVLAAVMLGRFVAGMAAGAASTGAVSIAIFALQARAAGAATTMEALAFAGTVAGRSLLAAFGGPIGIAVTALALGIGYLASQNAEADRRVEALGKSAETAATKADLFEQRLKDAGVAIDTAGQASDIAKSKVKALGDQLANTASQAGHAAQTLLALEAIEIRKQRGDLDRQQKQIESQRQVRAYTPIAYTPGGGGAVAFRPATSGDYTTQDRDALNLIAQQRKDLDRQEQALQLASQKGVDIVSDRPSAPSTVKSPVTSGARKSASSNSSSKADPADIARRFADDLAAGEQQIAQAQADALGTAEARRALEYSQIDYEKGRNARQIAGDKSLSDAQKEQLLQQNDRIAGEKKRAVYAEVLRDAQQRQAQAEQNSAQYAEDALRADAAMATTRQASLEANLRILDSLEAQEKAHLEAQIAAGEIADAEKARADLATTQAARRTTTERDHESPLEKKRREVRETAANMGDAIENIQVDAVDHLSDSLGDAAANYVKLGGIAGDVINSIIRDLIRLAAQQALVGSIGSIGKALGLGGSISLSSNSSVASAAGSYDWSSYGFASGGYTGDGGKNQVAGFVHKGEFVVPADAVKRIGVQNLAAMTNARAAAAMAGTTAAGVAGAASRQEVIVQVQANDYFDARVDQRATNVAAPIGVAAANQGRSAAGSDSARAARRRIP